MLKQDEIYDIHLKKNKAEKHKIKIVGIIDKNVIFELLDNTIIKINDHMQKIGDKKLQCSMEYFDKTFKLEDSISIEVKKKTLSKPQSKPQSKHPSKYLDKIKAITHTKKSFEDANYAKLCSDGSYYCCYLCTNTFYQNHHKKFRRIINELDLSNYQKIIIYDRYLKTVEYYFCSKRCYDFLYYIMKFLIQSCSIVVPALLSIEYFFEDSTVFINENENESILLEELFEEITADNINNPIFWSVWGLSLLVGLLTNIIGLFGIDSKFFTTGQTYLKLISEGWQYFELTGKYSVPDNKRNEKHVINSHRTQFNNFCNEIEKLYKNETELRYVAPIASDDRRGGDMSDDDSDD
jgi:hypothetical protein